MLKAAEPHEVHQLVNSAFIAHPAHFFGHRVWCAEHAKALIDFFEAHDFEPFEYIVVIGVLRRDLAAVALAPNLRSRTDIPHDLVFHISLHFCIAFADINEFIVRHTEIRAFGFTVQAMPGVEIVRFEGLIRAEIRTDQSVDPPVDDLLDSVIAEGCLPQGGVRFSVGFRQHLDLRDLPKPSIVGKAFFRPS